MFKQLGVLAVFVLSTVGLSSTASAGLIGADYGYGASSATPGVIGGYTMTDFDLTDANDIVLSGTATGVDSPISGRLEFVERYDRSASKAFDWDLASENSAWWNNFEGSDYDIFTTGTTRNVTLLLPENTFAFSFSVGSSNSVGRSNNAWVSVEGSDGSSIPQYDFRVDIEKTSSFSVYAENSNGSCNTVNSITIDPTIWGMGNFSINQDASICNVSVPEPSSFALFALGIVGIGATRWKKKA